MAHNLNIENGEAAIAYAGKVPWHGLGTQVDGLMTAEEAIVAGHLDWDVQVHPLQVPMAQEDGSTEFLPVPDKFGIVRMDNLRVLGTVGNRYVPVPNSKCFEIFDSVVADGTAKYEVVGALGYGETIWLLAKIPGEMRIFGTDDITEKYLLLTTSHDGTSPLSMYFTPVRVVCNNTLNVAVGNRRNAFSMRHTTNVMDKVEDARKMLGFALATYDKIEDVFNGLAKRQITSSELDTFVNRVFPVIKTETNKDGKASSQLQERRNDVKNQFDTSSNRLPGIRGTAWAAYNSVTQYVDHVQRLNASDDATKRLKHVWMGSGSLIKRNALDEAFSLVSTEPLSRVLALN